MMKMIVPTAKTATLPQTHGSDSIGRKFRIIIAKAKADP